VIRIGKFERFVIEENSLGFFKRNSVFPSIRLIFGLIPLKSKHNYIIIMNQLYDKCHFRPNGSGAHPGAGLTLAVLLTHGP
jgi:hypothetical protein